MDCRRFLKKYLKIKMLLVSPITRSSRLVRKLSRPTVQRDALPRQLYHQTVSYQRTFRFRLACNIPLPSKVASVGFVAKIRIVLPLTCSYKEPPPYLRATRCRESVIYDFCDLRNVRHASSTQRSSGAATDTISSSQAALSQYARLGTCSNWRYLAIEIRPAW